MKRFLIAIVLVAACGDAAAVTEPPADTVPTTTSTTTVPPTTVAPATTLAAPETTTTVPFDCEVTLPGNGFAPPEGYPPAPTDGVWYGTAELWTVLPEDGASGLRKSVWWSVNFPGGSVEEQPEISVVWRNLATGEVHEHPAPGTNAYTPEDGDFMINGIDPDTSGCWEVTATYKGASLSYVYSS